MPLFIVYATFIRAKNIICWFYIYIYIYIYYIYIYIHTHTHGGAYDKFPDFFRMGIWNCRRLLKNSVCYCYTSYEMTDQFL